MARLELNRSLRPASCCRVEVMNGADGDRRNGLWVIDFTAKGTSASPAASDRASASASTTTDPGEVRCPGVVEVAARGQGHAVHRHQGGGERTGRPLGGPASPRAR